MSDKKVLLVTGTRKGIGRATAEHFVRRGFAVVGCSRTEPDWSVEGYTHVVADVTDEARVRALISRIGREHQRLDGLINNVGAASMNHFLLTPDATATKLMDVNFRATFLCSREAAKLMKRQRFGRIVNFTTVAVPFRLEGEAIYAASKGAVETLTRVMARELAEFGITCNLVGPTPIDTDLIRAVPEPKIQSILDRQAIKRKGSFDDVINVIEFYLRPESDFVTGQCIYLGGV